MEASNITHFDAKAKARELSPQPMGDNFNPEVLAMCNDIQNKIEQALLEAIEHGKILGRKEAYEDAADYCLIANVNRSRMREYLDSKSKQCGEK